LNSFFFFVAFTVLLAVIKVGNQPFDFLLGWFEAERS
jgi:hypothetical protein